MDFGLAFSFPFQDNDWLKKIAIGALLVFSVIGNIAVLGWTVEIVRRVRRGDPTPLPDWTDFGTLVADGLKMLALAIIWTLPISLVGACVGVLSAVSENFARDAAPIMAVVSSLVSFCIGLPWGLLVGVLFPAAIGHYSAGNTFGSALNPVTAFKVVRANVAGFLITWFLGGIAVSLLGSLGALVCLVGFFPAVTYGSAVYGHMAGQAYREAEAAGIAA